MTAKLTERQFERRYNPLDGPDGDMVWQYAQLADIPLNRVWTLVDGAGEMTYAIPGYHVVNAWGYAVTEKPWTDPDIEAVWTGPADR